MKRLSILFWLAGASPLCGQHLSAWADSIRVAYHIPSLSYAVVSAEKVLALEALGYKKNNSTLIAGLEDRYRIGSNTKTITSYLAALLINAGKIEWHTKFFDLYPELKTSSHPAYYETTLQDLLTFRAPLISWAYTNDQPTRKAIRGNKQQQRYRFVAWVLQQPPPSASKTVYWSNPGYVAAGLMLEKAAGKDYETLVNDLGNSLGIHFGFGQPNQYDQNQMWGHDANLKPEKPANNHKLNWLSAAGNLHVSLPDYAKFVQLQLQGLSGKSAVLPAATFNFMHYGLPEFAVGWNWYIDEDTSFKYSFHKGNPGTFLTKVYLCKDLDRAYILFANIQSDEAEKGLNLLLDQLKKKYNP